MQINYVKRINTGYCKGYGYQIKDIELCCNSMKYALVNNSINMNNWSPYKHRNYYLILTNDKHKSPIQFCPYCGKLIILNQLEDESYNLDSYNSERIINKWDKFYPYDFDENQRFYNCKYERRELL